MDENKVEDLDEDLDDSTRLFSDITECDECPFRKGGTYEECCGSGPDGYHPCEWRNEEFKGKTVEEVIEIVYQRCLSAEAYWERKADEDEAEKIRKEKAKEKRKQSRIENAPINNQIKRLKKQIKVRQDLLIHIESVNMTNAIMSGKELTVSDEKHPLQIEIEQFEARIEELKKSKRSKKK